MLKLDQVKITWCDARNSCTAPIEDAPSSACSLPGKKQFILSLIFDFWPFFTSSKTKEGTFLVVQNCFQRQHHNSSLYLSQKHKPGRTLWVLHHGHHQCCHHHHHHQHHHHHPHQHTSLKNPCSTSLGTFLDSWMVGGDPGWVKFACRWKSILKTKKIHFEIETNINVDGGNPRWVKFACSLDLQKIYLDCYDDEEGGFKYSLLNMFKSLSQTI